MTRLIAGFAILTLLLPFNFCVAESADDNSAALPDLALQPPRVLTDFGPDHVKSSRGAQGVPAIERSAQGRLWAVVCGQEPARG